MPTKECPLCTGSMRLRITEQTLRVPGNPKDTVRQIREWVCPDCDYFEDAEEEDDG